MQTEMMNGLHGITVSPPGLDAISVIFCDLSPGCGQVTVVCFGKAWSAWFGSMGKSDIRQFVRDVDVDYLVGKLARPKETAAEQKYLARIVAAVEGGVMRALRRLWSFLWRSWEGFGEDPEQEDGIERGGRR